MNDQGTVDRCDGQEIVDDCWPLLGPESFFVLNESNTAEDHVSIVGDLCGKVRVRDFSHLYWVGVFERHPICGSVCPLNVDVP